MVNSSRVLNQLCDCFRGVVPKGVNWMSLLALANRTLTTPSLIEFTCRFRQQIPDDVCLYVQGIYERNLVRNDRLMAQLIEAVEAMNDRGLTPVLLKGGAMLATVPRIQMGLRLISDLDLMVPPDEVEIAWESLFAVGYRLHFQTTPHAEKWYAELKRPSDVGMIDLHRDAPGPAFFYSRSGRLSQHCKLTAVGRGTAYVPSGTHQALILIVHDQFQDYDYWVGNIDIRHLLDLRDLAQSAEGIDWDMLASLMSGDLAKNALETQLVALSSLLGVDVPMRLRSRLIPRLQYRRRLAQARFPLLRRAFLPMALLDYRNYRNGPGASKNMGANTGRRRVLPRRNTLRFLLALAREQRAGKI
jgi:hypothetical protein